MKYSVGDIICLISDIYSQPFIFDKGQCYEIMQVDHLLRDYLICAINDFNKLVKIDAATLEANSFVHFNEATILETESDYTKIKEYMEKKSLTEDDVINILEKWT